MKHREVVTHQRVDDRDCPRCGLRMVPVHGHYECRGHMIEGDERGQPTYTQAPGCGYRDSCCDGGEQ